MATNCLMSGHVANAATASQKYVLLGRPALGSLKTMPGQAMRAAATKATNTRADHRLAFQSARDP